VADWVWWLASIIHLEQGLVIYIDNLQNRTARAEDEELRQDLKPMEGNISPAPRDLQEDWRLGCEENSIHPDRRSQVDTSSLDISDLSLDAIRRDSSLEVINSTREFIKKSRKDRKAFNKQQRVDKLSRTRSGKIVKPITPGQRKYLQCIPKDSIREYWKIGNRIYGSGP
jgi:phosphate starvation-inducible protein PhoH